MSTPGTRLVLIAGVNYAERKLSAVVLGGALLVSNFVTATAQQGIGTAGISGTINAALKLSVPGGWISGDQLSSVRAEVEPASNGAIQIAISGNGDGQPAQITLPLEIRTNVAYELRVSAIAITAGVPAITTSISSASPSGRLVRQVAVEGSVATRGVSIASLEASTRLLAGPRVSLAGDYSSPNNALIAKLIANVATGSSCPWRATLLLSLRQAGR